VCAILHEAHAGKQLSLVCGSSLFYLSKLGGLSFENLPLQIEQTDEANKFL
jgi:hypothetical protein